MNREDSIKYLEDLKLRAQEDLSDRFHRVSKEFKEDLNGDKQYHKDYQEVMGWMFELFKVNSTTFYSLFKDVLSGATDLETLEGLEEMRFFVGNFFDDAYVKLVVDDNREYDHPIKGKIQMEIDPVHDWHLEWGGYDDEKTLTTEELIQVMRDVYQADYEWCKKFNKHFGGDETTKVDKFDKSLLKKEKA